MKHKHNINKLFQKNKLKSSYSFGERNFKCFQNKKQEGLEIWLNGKFLQK